MNRRHSQLAAGLLLVCGLGACRGDPEVQSIANLYDAEARRIAAAEKSRSQFTTPEFERAFRLLRRSVVRLPRLVDGAPVRLTRCAADERGNLYLGSRDTTGLFVWASGTDHVREVALRGDARSARLVGLSWSHEEGALYALDISHNRLLKLYPGAGTADWVPINGGQTPFTLAAMGGERVLVGGERWEDKGRATLLAVYDAEGRLSGSFFPMDSAVQKGGMDILTPVVLAPAGRDRAIVAEPTSYRISVVRLDGTVERRFGEAPQGYRAPTPVPRPLPPLEEMQAWRKSWTPLLFLHAPGNGRVIAGFQVSRGREGYRLVEYAPDGRNLADNVLTSRRPACAQGPLVYFITPVAADAVELAAFRYEPGAAEAGKEKAR